MNWNMKYESIMDFDQNHKTWLIIYTFLKGTNLIDNNTALFLWSCSAVVIVGHWRRVLRKRETVYVGNVEGSAFLPTSIFHQISSPSYPNYQLPYHFFWKSYGTYWATTVTMRKREVYMGNVENWALFPSSNQRTSTDLTAGAHLFRQGIPIYSVTQLHHNSPPHDVGITSQSDYTKWVMSIEYWELNN